MSAAHHVAAVAAGQVVRTDRLIQEGARKARLAKLRREAVDREGEAAVEESAIRRLGYEIEQRCIRAPVGGRVGEAAWPEARSGIADPFTARAARFR